MKELIVRTKEEIRTMTDPYRVDIIQIFRKNDNEPMTVKQIADQMGEPHGKVYYHIKKLLKVDAVKLEREEKIKSITAKYYVLNFQKLSFARDEGNEEDDTLVVNHATMMVSKLFDDSKQAFIEFAKTGERNEEIAPQKEAYLASTNLYLNKDTLDEFTKELFELIEKYGCKDEEHTFVKTFFYAMFSEKNRK